MDLREHLRRAGKANKGKPKSPEHRAKLAAHLAKLREAKQPKPNP